MPRLFVEGLAGLWLERGLVAFFPGRVSILSVLFRTELGARAKLCGFRLLMRARAFTTLSSCMSRSSVAGLLWPCGGFVADKTEVHLFLGGIDFVDLDGDSIAETNDAAAAATDELVVMWFEHVEVVFDRREWNDAAHREAGNIDEEAEIAKIGNKRRVAFGLAGFKLGFKESEEFDVLTVTLGIGRVSFGNGDVFGGLGKGVEGASSFIKKGAMHDQVSVAADG